jgi:hypothetical protein
VSCGELWLVVRSVDTRAPCRMNNTEAPCERWVGELKYLWDERQGPSTSTLTKRLRMRVGGVRGDGTDEAFVKHVAQSVYSASNIRKSTKVMSRYRDGSHVGFAAACGRLPLDSLEVVEVSGTGRAGMAKVRACQPKPAKLESAELALFRKVSRSTGGSMALPLFAATQKQWQNDLDVTTKDRLSTDRAKQWAVGRAATTRATCSASSAATVRPTCSSSSSSSSGSSSSSSSGEGSSEPADDVGMPTASVGVSSSSLVASSSELKPTTRSEATSLADVQWVQVRGGVVHARVDSSEGVALLCRPHRNVEQDCARGDSLNDPAAQGCRLCKNCAKLLARTKWSSASFVLVVR